MEAHTIFFTQQAFVVTNQEVTKIWKTFEEIGMEVEAKATCSDGLVRHFKDNSMLTQYENPRRASVTGLEISGRCLKPYMSAEIILNPQYYFSERISVSIWGEENFVSSMRITINDILNGTKPWYSSIATISFNYIWITIFWVAYALLMTKSDTMKQSISLNVSLITVAFIVTVLALICTMIWGVYWLRKRFFPVATFAIGQGLIRHQHYEQIRWVVIVGFMVSILASIVVTVLRL